MNIGERLPAFVDYETFWDVGYSLRSPKVSTTDYIHDTRFAIHGAACAIADADPVWLQGEKLFAWLEQARKDGRIFVGHHVLFDGYITTHCYGLEFEEYFCTMGLLEALMQTAMDNSVPGIDADCGGGCACGTCHVIVDGQWFNKTGSPSDTELKMLYLTPEHEATSRLSCQIDLDESLDGMIVRLPEFQM